MGAIFKTRKQTIMAAKIPKKSLITQIFNLPSGLLTFIKQAREELKKVQWPTREVTTQYTIVVIFSSIVVGAFVGGVDYLLMRLLETIII